MSSSTTACRSSFGSHDVPTYQGEVAGYPVYNGWIVMTKNGRLPWIPQNAARPSRPGGTPASKAIDEWTATKASRHPLDMTADEDLRDAEEERPGRRREVSCNHA